MRTYNKELDNFQFAEQLRRAQELGSPRESAKKVACNCAIGHNGIRNGAHRYRYAPLTVLRTPAKAAGILIGIKIWNCRSSR